MKLWGAILAALLAGVLYLQWQVVPVQAPPIPRPRLDAPSGPVGPGAGTPAGGFKIGLDERAEYDGISRRPLFNESRRPDEPDAAAAAPQQDQDLEGLVLSAVLITPTQRVAWVRDGQAAQTLKLTAGERIRALGLQFNAGHGLSTANVGPVAALPGLGELHIGHSIVSRAVIVGMRAAVAEIRAAIDAAAASGSAVHSAR